MIFNEYVIGPAARYGGAGRGRGQAGRGTRMPAAVRRPCEGGGFCEEDAEEGGGAFWQARAKSRPQRCLAEQSGILVSERQADRMGLHGGTVPAGARRPGWRAGRCFLRRRKGRATPWLPCVVLRLRHGAGAAGGLGRPDPPGRLCRGRRACCMAGVLHGPRAVVSGWKRQLARLLQERYCKRVIQAGQSRPGGRNNLYRSGSRRVPASLRSWQKRLLQRLRAKPVAWC